MTGHTILPDLLALLAFPFVLMALTTSWTFLSPTGYIDPHLYTGFFLDLREYLVVHEGTYYASRVPWLLLGNIAYSLFDPGLANLVLRFLLFYTATIAIYGTFRLVWQDRTAGLIAALILGVNAYFLQMNRWDYINGVGVSLFLLTLFLVTVAAKGIYWRRMLLLAGFVAMTAMSIHLFQITLMPVLAVWYVVINHRSKQTPVLIAPPLFVLGAVLHTWCTASLTTDYRAISTTWNPS